MADDRTWFTLHHRPGPAVEAGQTVFDHPGIGLHYAFLGRMAEQQRMVAGGPLLDDDGEARGEGLTVLTADSLDEARRIAEQEDESVVQGVLTVEVRAWHVLMAPVTGG